ncbi:MAG: hypothetical protein DHS20C08_03840 [Rhodomicrobium sp.]|nr:MAG: hypothetical protein DHS20C08_03840 [Rhodomicrobium sp.]
MEQPSDRSIWSALTRGAQQKCPSCGEGKLFDKYLKVVPNCQQCGEELHHHRADDAPPYFTIFIIGHILVPLMMWVEIAYKPALWIHSILWLPLTLALCYWTLPRVKGALIGLQWAMRMHGFNPEHDEAAEYGGNTPV